MTFTPIDKNNLPQGRVLGACYQLGYGYDELLVGYIHLTDEGTPAMETEYELLKPITHYMLLDKASILKEIES